MASLNISKVNDTLLHLKSSSPITFFNSNKKIKVTKKLRFSTLNNANIILFPKKINKKKMLIVGSYKELQDNKNSIGAIYLKKGRTQIIFVKERLKNNGLDLPKAYKKHLINECKLNLLCFLKGI